MWKWGCPRDMKLWKRIESVSHSVVSNSSWPHGLQPIRLLCPRDSPSKNTGVGCHFLLQGIFPTQGSNPDLPHCGQILYRWSYLGKQAYQMDQGVFDWNFENSGDKRTKERKLSVVLMGLSPKTFNLSTLFQIEKKNRSSVCLLMTQSCWKIYITQCQKKKYPSFNFFNILFFLC